MSQNVSAFATYKLGGKKYGSAAKKTVTKKTVRKNGISGKPQPKAKSAATGKTVNGVKATSVTAKSVGVKAESGKTTATKPAAIKPTGAKVVSAKPTGIKSTGIKPVAAEAITAKPGTKSSVNKATVTKCGGGPKKKQDINMGATVGKPNVALPINGTPVAKILANKVPKLVSTAQDKFKHGNVDDLVGQLYGDSPSHDQKLSKEQKKIRGELEAYLEKELAKGSDSDEYDSEEGDEDSDYTDSEFSTEYSPTDSYTDISGGEEETDEQSGLEFNLQAIVKPKATAKKRKSFNGAPNNIDENRNVAEAINGAPEIKKQKKSDEKVAAPSCRRQDKPTALSSSVTGENVTASSSNRNSVIGKNVAVSTSKRNSAVGRNTVAPSCSRNSDGNISKSSNASEIAIKSEPPSPPADIVNANSVNEGLRLFRWLMNPITIEDFYGKYWEKNACLIKRNDVNHFNHLISFSAINQMMLRNHVEFTKNIDVTSYKNGVRETLNPEGRAMPPVVWEHYEQGCSIRLLNPQTFIPALFTLNTTLQEYFHCFVGANVYLTPPNSQGFAPHYDDIDAFVLQVEGRKRWKLYKPRFDAEVLPRFSSGNLTQSEIGKPILEEVLTPGAVLYMPRGTIHQACTEAGHHSLHITLSIYQKHTYGDLFEHMVPMILKRAIATNVQMRQGLPLHTWHHAGIAFSDVDTKERAQLMQKVSQLLKKTMQDMCLADMMDAAVDQIAKKFQHEALPPEILPSEHLRTVFGTQTRLDAGGDCEWDYKIDLRTNVRLLRANILRLVSEEQKVHIYYYLDNSKEYCEYEPNFIEIDPSEAGSVEVLIKSYPKYIGVSQLPLTDDERKIQVVTALWERGLLMTEKPF